MKTVTVNQTVPGSVPDVESRWYDTGRWASWVDGFDHIVESSGAWPQVGANLSWQSGPAGRGRVAERVVAYEPLAGQTLEVEDDSIKGRQWVAFTPSDERVVLTLGLEYEIKRSSFFTPLIDLLFIRRAMAASMQATLVRFRAEFSGRAA